MTKTHTYAILGAVESTTTWDGSPQTIVPPNGLTMPQTNNGSMVFAYQNNSPGNNGGNLILTSGGSQPMPLIVQAGLLQPTMLVNNWHANNLNVTNTSPVSGTPIWCEAFGPGLPGQTPVKLPVGTPIALSPLGGGAGTNSVAQGTTQPNYMQLSLVSNTANLTIMAVIGGPPDASGNNAYVIALNSASGNTGPGTPTPAPQGYYATAGGNSYAMIFNWSSSVIYVANMSPSTAAPCQVTMISL